MASNNFKVAEQEVKDRAERISKAAAKYAHLSTYESWIVDQSKAASERVEARQLIILGCTVGCDALRRYKYKRLRSLVNKWSSKNV